MAPITIWQRPPGPLNQYFNDSSYATTLRGTARCPGHALFAFFLDSLESAGVGTQSLQEFGITYNCLRQGGDRITLIGHNFGNFGARVTVNGRPCFNISHDVPQTVVSCTAPSGEAFVVCSVSLFSRFKCSCPCLIRLRRISECHDCKRHHAVAPGYEAILLVHCGASPSPSCKLFQHWFAALGHQLARRLRSVGRVDDNWLLVCRVFLFALHERKCTGILCNCPRIERRAATVGPEVYVGQTYNDRCDCIPRVSYISIEVAKSINAQ